MAQDRELTTAPVEQRKSRRGACPETPLVILEQRRDPAVGQRVRIAVAMAQQRESAARRVAPRESRVEPDPQRAVGAGVQGIHLERSVGGQRGVGT